MTGVTALNDSPGGHFLHLELICRGVFVGDVAVIFISLQGTAYMGSNNLFSLVVQIWYKTKTNKTNKNKDKNKDKNRQRQTNKQTNKQKHVFF